MSELRYIDVSAMFDVAALKLESDPGKTIVDVLRRAAETKCDEAHVELRTDTPPELIKASGIDPATGRDAWVVASRWAIRGTPRL